MTPRSAILRIRPRHQRGVTLLIVLVMLVVLTLFGITAINVSTSNLQVVGNMQVRKTNEAVANQAVETILSSISYFNNPAQPLGYAAPTGYTITADNRVCLFAAPAASARAMAARRRREEGLDMTGFLR